MSRDRLCLPATPAPPVLQSLLGFVWPVPTNATMDMISLSCTPKGNVCLCADHTNRNHPVCFTLKILFVNSPIFLFYCCRNFRCDCGNGRFKGFQCQLIPVSPLPLLCLTYSVSPSLSAVCVPIVEVTPPLVFTDQG